MPRRSEREEAAPSSSSTADATPKLFGAAVFPPVFRWLIGIVIQALLGIFALYNAYRIRTYALTEYGMVIHEFDPWFNFRATQYLSKKGWYAFFHWFDHMSWYPLGRPVGTTIYPGLQITAVGIHRALKALGPAYKMSLNDVCCTMPCWFGSLSTLLMALITYECSGSRTAATISALIFAVIPAHMMRSVGGGFDNESIAVFAMLLTFYCWIRSLRSSSSWWMGVLTGLAYGYMVAAWGGFVFVLNMIAVHAAGCVVLDTLRNKYNPGLHRSYSLFFVIGTALAIHVPPVGWMPFKSLEQLFAFAVFVALQLLHIAEGLRRKADVDVLSPECFRIRARVFMYALVGGVVAIYVLLPEGYFGPLSSRVRGLFVQHTRTGNPLVDSVAEHQPATAEAYWSYLHYASYGWQFGLFLTPVLCAKNRFYAMSFVMMYGIVAYFFSLKMARLIILSGPVATAMTSIILGHCIDWAVNQIFWSDAEAEQELALRVKLEEQDAKAAKHAHKGRSQEHTMGEMISKMKDHYKAARSGRVALAVVVLAIVGWQRHWNSFNEHAEQMAHSFANPQIMFKSRLQNGQTVMIDDYRDAYFWLRDKTPQDSRVMAWWDYGYQITGIGNRTTIADGNTWNHEHIATLGYCLTSPVERAWGVVRHIADYVLVWSGGGGDDLAKSPHMARIGNSVYHTICPDDPLCMKFGFKGQNHQDPTPMMRKSLLYNLHAHKTRPGVKVDPKFFTEAFTSKYGLVRIFKVTNISEESKAFLADPANRKCDAPGSWYCEGQYPTTTSQEWKDLIQQRVDFAQLEDWQANKKRGEADKKKFEEYQRKYHARMAGH